MTPRKETEIAGIVSLYLAGSITLREFDRRVMRYVWKSGDFGEEQMLEVRELAEMMGPALIDLISEERLKVMLQRKYMPEKNVEEES